MEMTRCGATNTPRDNNEPWQWSHIYCRHLDDVSCMMTFLLIAQILHSSSHNEGFTQRAAMAIKSDAKLSDDKRLFFLLAFTKVSRNASFVKTLSCSFNGDSDLCKMRTSSFSLCSPAESYVATRSVIANPRYAKHESPSRFHFSSRRNWHCTCGAIIGLWILARVLWGP